MALKTTRWDTAKYLKTKEDIAAYLDVALEDGDPEVVKLALSNIARAKGMTEVAKQAHLGRASLYKALSPDGNPEFTTVAKVLKTLGLRLSVATEKMRRAAAVPVTASRKPARRGTSAKSGLRKLRG